MAEIQKVLKDQLGYLMTRKHVVGTGIGFKRKNGKLTGEIAIVCNVALKVDASMLSFEDVIPKEIEGYVTDVRQTGVIRALQAPTGRFRPAPGGVSVGHYQITAGTLGVWAKKQNGSMVLLSNNHVLANSNAANIGDPILQPGPYDGGKDPDDRIATLVDFEPVKFFDPAPPSDCPLAKGVAGFANLVARAFRRESRLVALADPIIDYNLVDCAIASPDDNAFVDPTILNIGAPLNAEQGALGMPIQKMGRTTGLTTGVIDQIDVTTTVQYGAGQVAFFQDQLMAGAMSAGGDSGSLVLDMDRHPVGLLFAGSDTTTVINRIQNVEAALGIVVGG